MGSRFACSSNNRGHCAFAWSQLLRDCKDDQERQLKQAEMDASIKALHYQTGKEVGIADEANIVICCIVDILIITTLSSSLELAGCFTIVTTLPVAPL